MKNCANCDKSIDDHVNYCSWDCHIELAKAAMKLEIGMIFLMADYGTEIYYTVIDIDDDTAKVISYDGRSLYFPLNTDTWFNLNYVLATEEEIKEIKLRNFIK